MQDECVVVRVSSMTGWQQQPPKTLLLANRSDLESEASTKSNRIIVDVELSRRRQIAELLVDGARGDRSQTWASMHFGSTLDRRSCELVPCGPGNCRGGAVDTVVRGNLCQDRYGTHHDHLAFSVVCGVKRA